MDDNDSAADATAGVEGAEAVVGAVDQGLTLVSFSAQPEPFLTQSTPKRPPLIPPNPPLIPLTPSKQPLNPPPVA